MHVYILLLLSIYIYICACQQLLTHSSLHTSLHFSWQCELRIVIYIFVVVVCFVYVCFVYERRDTCKTELSGKMVTLHHMLTVFTARNEKVLVFSYSTRVLDIIEDSVRGKGWGYRRLDGSTAVNKRQKLVDEFNNNSNNSNNSSNSSNSNNINGCDRRENIQLFLASSKAGGLGLNLKAASKGFTCIYIHTYIHTFTYIHLYLYVNCMCVYVEI